MQQRYALGNVMAEEMVRGSDGEAPDCETKVGWCVPK